MNSNPIIPQNQLESIRQVAQHYGAQQVRVFGSTARRENTEASDLDLLVNMAPGSTLLDIVAIKQDLEDLLQRKDDVVTEVDCAASIGEKLVRIE